MAKQKRGKLSEARRSKRFNCDICKKNFWSARGMNMHSRLKHISDVSDMPNNEQALFTNVPQDKSFHVADGSVLRNILELSDKLGIIEEWAFRHHVNEEKNDFANWIAEVFENKDLSTRVSQYTDKKDIQITLLKEIISSLRQK